MNKHLVLGFTLEPWLRGLPCKTTMNEYMKSSTSVNPLTKRYGPQASVFPGAGLVSRLFPPGKRFDTK